MSVATRCLPLALALAVAACGGDEGPVAGEQDVAVAEVSELDSGEPLDAAVLGGECSASSDCTGDLQVCQAWACNQGVCFKVAAPDGAICEEGGPLPPRGL